MKKKAILAGVATLTVGMLPASAFALPASAFARSHSEYTFQKVATIHLKGPKGHGDLLSLDPDNGRIIVSMHDHGVDIVDSHTNKVVKWIPDVPGPNGNAYHDGYFYVASDVGKNGHDEIAVIGADSMKVVNRVMTQGTGADWVGVDPDTKTLYVGMDDKNWDEMYSLSNPEKPKYIGKFDLYPSNPKAGPDVGTVVPSSHTIYQVDDSYILKLTTEGKLEKHIDTGVKLKKHGGTKASYFDSKNDRLWVASTNSPNPGVFVLTPDLGIIKTLPESGGVDDAEADPGLGLLYLFSSSSKGFDVYNLNNTTWTTHVNTGVKITHTGLVDPATHEVYAFGGAKAELNVYKPVKRGMTR